MSIERGFFSGIVKTTVLATAIHAGVPAELASTAEAATRKTTTTVSKKEVLKKKTATTKKGLKPVITTSTTLFETPKISTTTTKPTDLPTSTTIVTEPTSSTIPTSKVQLTAADLPGNCWVRFKPVTDPNKFVDPDNPFYKIENVMRFKKPPFIASMQGCGLIASAMADYANPAPPGTKITSCGENKVLGIGSTNTVLTYIVAEQDALLFPLDKEQAALDLLKLTMPNAQYTDGQLINKSLNGWSPLRNSFSLANDFIRQGVPTDSIAAKVCDSIAPPSNPSQS